METTPTELTELTRMFAQAFAALLGFNAITLLVVGILWVEMHFLKKEVFRQGK